MQDSKESFASRSNTRNGRDLYHERSSRTADLAVSRSPVALRVPRIFIGRHWCHSRPVSLLVPSLRGVSALLEQKMGRQSYHRCTLSMIEHLTWPYDWCRRFYLWSSNSWTALPRLYFYGLRSSRIGVLPPVVGRHSNHPSYTYIRWRTELPDQGFEPSIFEDRFSKSPYVNNLVRHEASTPLCFCFSCRS